MGARESFSKKDEDKTREELVDELEALHSHYSRLKAIVQRYERAAGKKDVYCDMHDLEAEREHNDLLRDDQLQKKHEETDLESVKLEVQKEHIKASLEELCSNEEAARRKIAEVVEMERKRLFDVLENLPAMICLLTPDHHVAFANRAFREKFGESKGRYCYEYCYGRTEPCDFCETYSVLKTGKPHRWEVACLDGSVIDVYNVPFTDPDGKPLILEMNIDITERVQAESALRKSETSLIKSQEMAHIGNWEMDVTSGELIWSKEIYHIFGLDPTCKPDFDVFKSLIVPEDRQRVLGVIQDSMRSGDLYNIEYSIRLADGTKKVIHTICEAEKDAAGRVLKLFGTSHDITERKLAEDALQDSESRLKAFLENSAVIGWMKDVDGRYVFVSGNYERRFNTRSEDWIGKSDFEFWPQKIAEQLRKNDQSVLDSGRSLEVIEEVVNPDGSKSMWQSFKFPYRDSSGKRYVGGLAVDITERKQAEYALRESEERFRQLADNSPIPMAINDKDDNITYLNRKFIEVFGYTLEDIPHLKYWWPRAYPDPVYRDDAIKRWEKGVEEAVRESKEIGPIDYTVTCKDGTVRYTEISGVPIGDKELVLLQDVTERKRAEAEIESAKQESELYLDLMGHDINNMHQIALGYLELASSMPASEEQEVFINKSVEVLQRSAQLISNVRKLQKLHEGMLQTQDIDVIPMLRNVQREYGSIPNKHIILNVNDCEHCIVHANELLHDVYANLITNAVKHTGDKADITIEVDVIKGNGNRLCRVMVEDNGPGIPHDKKTTIFKRTLKGTNEAKGMGLGLYIVKTLVDNYGGRVWVEDRVPGDYSKGARFVVVLPAVEK
jgi:PAS domain S-box-containing protein